MTGAAPSHPSAVSVDRHSQGINSMESSQMSLPKVLDPRGFRARFAHYWADFLHANYRNPEAVAHSFGVTFQTACNWWNGANRPSGDVVALAGREFADFLEGKQ